MEKWERRLINTKRGTFEVFCKGEGEPLCVTHNYSEFNDTGDYFANSFTKLFKVFLINLRETGNSEKAHFPYELSMVETIFDLEEIRKSLGYLSWNFAGHSTGGMLGIIYGIYFSNSLNHNIIVGAAARDYATFSKNCIYNWAHPQFNNMQDLIERLKINELSIEERKALSIERTKLSLHKPERYHEYFNLPISKKMSAIRLNYFNREFQIYDVTKKLALISCSTLIICGKHDVQCPIEYSEEMAEGIANSKLVILNQSNHYPFLEEKELFFKEVTQFTKKKLV
ncbi:alpha/beta fold hydrolase [Bacillus sp. AFS053548]|uniref:alpha/beta fold hydrolase n=1 Tax=Bacillus sp. AFS053548 TaxID=2033505 RepID=UPI000BFE669A|nr:alpha/beta fold hydrolase [Bacillus sp. AFS053548]PGM53330.1 proline iminopeptidase [Bacillus sp. AFS053548]